MELDQLKFRPVGLVVVIACDSFMSIVASPNASAVTITVDPIAAPK